MPVPNRLRLARTACDLFLLFIATICIIGSTTFFDTNFFVMLISISLLCGAVVGIGFGWTESVKVRRWLGVPVFAMCILQLIGQARVAWLGAYAECALSFSILSGLSIAVLLGWLCDCAISRRMHFPISFAFAPLTFGQRFFRVLHGLLVPYIAMCAVMTIAYLVQQDLLGQVLLGSLRLVWYATFSAALACWYWRQTSCTVALNVLSQDEISLLTVKMALIGGLCEICAIIGYTLQGDQSSWLIGVAMVLLAVIAGVKISQLKVTDPKPKRPLAAPFV